MPEARLRRFKGAKSREAPANLKPVGTGPYRFVDFKPGDMVARRAQPDYHVPNRPLFDTIEMKGGGDAASAARAVLQTGEYDYAWNMQVEDDILLRMEQGGKGSVIVAGGNIELIQLNFTDPVDRGRRRAVQPQDHASVLTRPRRAPGAEPAGRPGSIAGADLRPHRAGDRQLPERAGALPLQTRSASSTSTRPTPSSTQAGWKRGADGIRAKDGKKLKFVFQTSINAPRQKTQAIVKQACQKAGIEIELKSVAASVFFSSDVANPDTYPQFYADMQMYTHHHGPARPGSVHAPVPDRGGATKANKWQGRNITRWQQRGVRRLYKAAEIEIDPVKRAAMFIKMNDLVVNVRRHPAGGPGCRRRRQQARGRAQRLGQQHRRSGELVSGRLTFLSSRAELREGRRSRGTCACRCSNKIGPSTAPRYARLRSV